MNSAVDISQDVPLTETTFLIMLSISSRPRHGYAIMKDVKNLSYGRVVLSTGTLYGAIKRLLESRWIIRVEDADKVEAQNRRFRNVYRLSSTGQRVLEAELDRMKTLISIAKRRTQGAQA